MSDENELKKLPTLRWSHVGSHGDLIDDEGNIIIFAGECPTDWMQRILDAINELTAVRTQLAAAQKTIEANKRAMEWALKALRSINGWLDSAYPSLREAREQNYAARHTLTAALAATDGGVS